MNYNFVMKQNYKEMLIGFVAGQSQGRSKNNDSKLSGFELFKALWTWLFSAGFAILILLIAFSYTHEAKINFLGLSFEGARLFVITALLTFLLLYIYTKILERFQRFIFWGTFIPPVIYLIIWLFIPSLL